jgi:hypothetical protein
MLNTFARLPWTAVTTLLLTVVLVSASCTQGANGMGAQPTPTGEEPPPPTIPIATATATIAPTVPATATPTPTPSPSPTATPTPTPTVTPTPSTSFGFGTWIVGVGIAPGTYRSSGGGVGCTWERIRLDGYGKITVSSRVLDVQTVEIIATDTTFRTTAECGVWAPAPTNGPQSTTFGSGEWIVGVDIAPGTYRANGAGCLWWRLRGFRSTNESTIIGFRSSDVQTVTIDPNDAGFLTTADCGTWAPAPSVGSRATTFGAGT